jgi:hypothetical protein
MAPHIPVESWNIQLLVKEIMLFKMRQLILITGTAIWRVTEPD